IGILTRSQSFQHQLTDTDSMFFLHIPKTAGTTFGRVLESRFRREEIYPPHWLHEHRDASPATFAPYRYFRGHFHDPDIRLMLGNRHPVCLTMLRDPVDRFLSHFAFAQAERVAVDWYVSFADFPSLTLEEYVRDEPLVMSTGSLDPQTSHLGGNPQTDDLL